MIRSAIARWMERRSVIRRRWKTDAIALIKADEQEAYHAAQRLAARARARKNRSEFLHWAKVAAEVARLSPNAKMELSRVQEIDDEEHQRTRGGQN